MAAGPTVKKIREVYRGKIRLVIKNYPYIYRDYSHLAAEASLDARDQGKYWEMHDLLLERQDRLAFEDLVGYAGELGLDVERFEEDLRTRDGAGRIAEDVDSADLSGVSGTPTFFVNGLRHYGAYDIATLSAAVKAARARELVRLPA